MRARPLYSVQLLCVSYAHLRARMRGYFLLDRGERAKGERACMVIFVRRERHASTVASGQEVFHAHCTKRTHSARF